MNRKIEKVAVLGAGIMGSGIAAHLANCRIRCFLLDMVPKELSEDDKQAGLTKESPAFRNKLSLSGLWNALKNRKPIPAFYHDGFASLITCGNFEDNMEWVVQCDWVIEVVVENLEAKRKVFAEVEKHRKPGTIVSSNTSGLPIKQITEGRSPDFKKHFLVTHFFNPVRFMRLLELIGGRETDPKLLRFMAEFGTDVLGKGVVLGKDTPNFVGNRIGVFGIARTLKEMLDGEFAIEEVDAILGEPLARPKTAVFRTVDLVGLDTVVHILENCHENLPGDEARDLFVAPPFVKDMLRKNRLGNKTQAGFYKREKGGDSDQGDKDILVLDHKTGEYRPKGKVRFDSIGVAKNTEDPGARIRDFVQSADRAGQFAWAVFSDSLIYSGNRVGEIADDIVQIDNAMKWGFNWDLGPFEAWDAAGFKETCERMKKEGKKLPPIARAILKAKGDGFYKQGNRKKLYFDLRTKKYRPVPVDSKVIGLSALKRQKREITSNLSATLVDLGEGVLCCEFHSKMNSIDGDTIQIMNEAIDRIEQDDRWTGLVIGNQGQNFCAGANLMLIFMNAQQGNFAELEKAVKAFQDVCMRLKYSRKPVVAAPFGMTLGGGMEISMGADRVCAHADLFMGQVELGVGLIPAGGGTKELLVRNLEGLPENTDGLNLLPFLRVAFESIGMAKVSMSAAEAMAMHYLRPSDKIVTSRDHLLHSAKRMVQGMHLEGYVQPLPRKLKLPGEMGYATFRMMIDAMRKQHQISEHEQVLGEKLAWVLCGGRTSPNVAVSEQYILDLEREAFLHLCGMPKSQERMSHFLMKGKPLRN